MHVYRKRGTNDSLSNGQGYRWNVQHGGITLTLMHAFYRMYEVAMPLSAKGLHPKTITEFGRVLTVYLVSGFDTRSRDHGACELQVRMGRLVQFLCFSHLRPGECGALKVYNPVVEP